MDKKNMDEKVMELLKGKANRIVALVVMLSLVLTLGPVSETEAKKSKNITVNKSTVSLQVKETETLSLKNVSVKDQAKVKWTTSNKKVASVTVNKKNHSTATVTAVKKGSAKITATLSGKKVSCKVTVKNRVYKSEKITFDPSWTYADCAKITSGTATLYRVTAKDAKHKVICINAGHGTAGGDQVKVPCHPDGSPKIVSGTTKAGATEATAISLGMTFLDGTPEAVGTLKAAMATKNDLLENGYDVLMIRESDDVQLDNIARTLIANNKADCHIAIHYDENITTRDAGVFFCSIPDNDTYKNMEPVKSTWQEDMRLGTSCVNGLVSAGLNRKGDGTLDMDLTQTSFSSVPSIDLGVGNQVSLLTDVRLSMVAEGIRMGLDDFYGYQKIKVYTEVKPVPTQAPAQDEGNLTYQSDVTAEMTKASYWSDQIPNADKVLLKESRIIAKNQKLMADPDTYMTDLKNMDMAYDASARQSALADGAFSDVTERIGSRTTIFRAGVPLDKPAIDAWFAEMKNNIATADVSSITAKRYAICTRRADLWMAPAEDPVGWSATDADSEFQNSAINVNEPFIIDGVTADGKYIHGTTNNCSGWTLADCFAICDDRDTWLSQWDLTSDQTLVVTTNRITLEGSNSVPATSKVELMLGTQLPLVPRDQLPDNIAERGTWYNYVVYLPTRDENGKLARAYGLIGEHNNVSVGWLPLTQANILEVAFNCLGDRYGWGGMLGAMDCSMYIRSIYRCFGFELPRNTTWQRMMPTYKVDFGPMTDTEKRNAIHNLPAGSLLMFSGHITMYIGEAYGRQYVISDMGSVAETELNAGDQVQAKSKYCVSVNSLDVRRASGNTWLTEMLTGLVPWKD